MKSVIKVVDVAQLLGKFQAFCYKYKFLDGIKLMPPNIKELAVKNLINIKIFVGKSPSLSDYYTKGSQ